jgi:catechol 2,3-dioxygenase-like lactoylglutathione lyase family enzyme
MKFEHLALNVPDAMAMSHWYVTHLGLTVLRGNTSPPYAHFLADETGRVFLELYSNPAVPCPDYASMPPLELHVAFFTSDAGTVKQTLLGAGATPFSDDENPDGSRLIFVRDPWGVALQLCQRVNPFPGFQSR